MVAKRTRIVSDLTGKRFGRLIVLSRAGSNHVGTLWLCECDCGGRATTTTNRLTSGRKRSCGCWEALRRYVHGHTVGKYSYTYQSWAGMKTRCLNPKDPGYAGYGARGITVCDRWLKFENFLADMGERPKGTTLDRYPDMGGNYEPGNCRWATMKEQQNNRRNNVVLEYLGERLTISRWAERSGIRPLTLRYRVLKLGWSMDRALNQPVGKSGPKGPRLAAGEI